MTDIEQNLIKRIADGDDRAIPELQSAYQYVVTKAFNKTITEGNFHRWLTAEHEHLLEDIYQDAWLKFVQRIRAKGGDVGAEPGRLLSRITSDQTKDLMSWIITRLRRGTRENGYNREFVSYESDVQNGEYTPSLGALSPESGIAGADLDKLIHRKATERQRKIFHLLRDGYKQKEIAEQLFVTTKTVYNDITTLKAIITGH